MEPGHLLVAVALVGAVGNWAAVARANRRAEYVLKPLVLVLLIAAAISFGDRSGTVRWLLTIAALGLSLIGDVFLMLPRDLFLWGLGSFLLAHLAYVGAFNTSAPPIVPTVWAAGAFALLGGVVFVRIRAGMVRKGSSAFQVPVAVYAAAIGAMVVSAISTAAREDWTAGHSTLAIGGALSFLASDGLIGWTRFVKSLRWGPVAIIVTYHLGQIGLLLGLLG